MALNDFFKNLKNDDYDKLSARLNKSTSEKTHYDFEWNVENKLRYISDKTLEIAYRLIEIGNLSLVEKDSSIVMHQKLASFCHNGCTTDDLLEKLEDPNPVINGVTVIKKDTFDFKAKKNAVEYVCEKCPYEKCPKQVAAYVLYLFNNGLLKEYLEDRKKFRETNKYNDYYTYEWDNKDGLKYIPENVYKFACKLSDTDLIWTSRTLEKNKIKICSAYSCNEYRSMNNNVDLITEEEIAKFKDKAYVCNLTRNVNSDLGVCNSYSCRLGGCCFIVAGYLKYLKTIGNTKQIELDRQYYKEHQEEIEQKNKNELLELIKNKEKSNVEKFNEYGDDIENLTDLVDTIHNTYQKSIHCAITGKDKNERKKFIQKITDALISTNKINNTCSGNPYTHISLQRFASRMLYENSSFISGDKDDTSGRLRDNTVYILDKNNYRIKETDAIIKLDILKDHLYVIDEISDFIRDYKYVKTLSSNNVSRKQFERTIDLLTNLEDNNYLILDGTEQEIDSLFSLDNRFKFAYQDSIFKIKEISNNDMFNKYCSLLKPNLFEELRNDKDGYEKNFEKYISLNREFIPLTNREIVNYLATYCNNKDKLEFPEDVYKKETVDEALKNIIGLDNIKSKVKEFEKYVLFRLKAKNNNMKLADFNMHMIFTGNPGVGKTMVARIMSKMLFDLGIIKENKLIEVERKDLIAKYIGQTAIKTSEVIEQAKGGVLFIDEAYTLAPTSDNDFGAEAIATLIKAMEDYKNELVIIFAGYKNEMKTFVDSNPGISSRVGYTFDFSDYSIDELKEIFYLKIKNMGFEIEENTDMKITNICKYFYSRKNFGNARFVDNLIQAVLMKHALDDDNIINKISLMDIPSIEELNRTSTSDTYIDTEKLLQDIVGMKELKQKIKDFASYVKFSKKAQNNNISLPNQNMHMIFTGNPGTGKTTIARILAKMLFDMGIIHENKLVEVDRKDLVGEYLGQTAPKTMNVIEKAMGGVLFIDEAYSLSSSSRNDSYGAEAIATLIKAMDDNKGKLIVIFAGYKNEMKEFIDANSGIASRIGYTFDFSDYTADELKEIFYRKAEKAGMAIDIDAEESVINIMKYFANVDNIGNGRFVDRVFQETLLKCAKNENENVGQITKNDIPTIKEITNNLFGGKDMIDVNNISELSLKKTAIHEIGHAAIRYILKKTPGIKVITINPEGTGTLGYVKYSTSKEGYTSTKNELEDNIKIALGGMAAEKSFIGTFSNGNTSDLEFATLIARNMVTKYGMSDVGFAYIEKENSSIEKVIFDEINKILQKAFEDALHIIEDNKEKIEKSIEYLLKNKEINEQEFVDVFEK